MVSELELQQHLNRGTWIAALGLQYLDTQIRVIAKKKWWDMGEM